MTADNFTNVLDSLRQLQPFRVFSVELRGGRRFEVDHPGALVIRDGVAVFLALGGVPIWFDHDSVNEIIGAPASEIDDRDASGS
ncbi:MAG TPA: hypothetical protein VGX76_12060 [Pirellulales bacterium]|jgi:hypothetical protein|nr:hypothetical protein [Pirellulales bacterium]